MSINNLELLGKNILSHLVLVYNPKSTDDIGSGVLVKVGEKYFVLTAAHFIKEEVNINLGLPFQYSQFKINNLWKDDKLDICFFEVDPFEIKIMSNDHSKPYHIQKRIKTKISTKQANSAVCGYPSILQEKKDNKIGFTPVFFACQLVHSDNWSPNIKSKKSPEVNISFLYGSRWFTNFYNLEGKKLPHIDPIGLSGSGIWVFRNEGENTMPNKYALIGIQNCYFASEKLAIGTIVDFVVDKICEKYSITF